MTTSKKAENVRDVIRYLQKFKNALLVIYLDDNASSHFNPIKDSMKIYKVFFKFMLSSFGSAILDFLIYSLLTVLLVGGSVPEFVRIHYIGVSTATARICSGIFNYNINRLLFKTKTKVKSSDRNTLWYGWYRWRFRPCWSRPWCSSWAGMTSSARSPWIRSFSLSVIRYSSCGFFEKRRQVKRNDRYYLCVTRGVERDP